MPLSDEEKWMLALGKTFSIRGYAGSGDYWPQVFCDHLIRSGLSGPFQGLSRAPPAGFPDPIFWNKGLDRASHLNQIVDTNIARGTISVFVKNVRRVMW